MSETNHTRSHEAFALPAVTTPEQRADVVGYLRMYGTAPIQAAADLIEADGAEIARLTDLLRGRTIEIKDDPRVTELEELLNEPIKLHHAGRLYSMLDLVDWFSEWLKRAGSLLNPTEKQS